MAHPFDDAVALVATGEDSYEGHLSPAYGNMVGPFGGAIAATLLNAALSHKARLGMPISVTINYAGPIADAPFVVVAKPVRTNRSTQHWLLTLEQNGQIAVTGTAAFATRHESWADSELLRPQAPDAEEVGPLSASTSAFLPPWVSQYDLRFFKSALTFDSTPGADSESLLWVRDAQPRPLDFLSLMAISDVFFPRSFYRQQRMAPAGTVSITTIFHADAEQLAAHGEAHLLASARALRFYRGYFDQAATLWSTSGELLASSTQVVYFKG